jgi:hypothetical protein
MICVVYGRRAHPAATNRAIRAIPRETDNRKSLLTMSSSNQNLSVRAMKRQFVYIILVLYVKYYDVAIMAFLKGMAAKE